MDKLSTTVYGVISLVVIVILIATVAIPVIEDSQKEQYSTANNTNALYTAANSTKAVTLEVNATNGNWVIDGVEDTQAFANYVDKAFGYNFQVVLGSSGSPATYKMDAKFYYENSWVTKNAVKKVEFDGSKIVVTASDDTVYNIDSSFLLYPYSKGDYAEYRGNTGTSSAKINVDSTVYIGITAGNYALVKGTMKGGFSQVGLVNHSGGYDKVTTNPTYVMSEDGLTYSLNPTPGLTFSDTTETVDPTTDTGNALYFVPLQYNYIGSNDSMIITLLSVIPLILIIVPIMLAVRMISSRRD